MPFFIVPEPRAIRIDDETPVFRLTDLCNLRADAKSANAETDLYAFLQKVFAVEPVGSGRETVTLTVDAAVGGAESYRLTVTNNHVTVIGADAAGVFYGVQTLKQLLLQGRLELPAVEIDDAPHISYRGFMLDVSRHFFAPDSVKLFLDAMALHKLNRLHLHLTDDQGWRVELYSHLLLAQIGGYRAFTNGGMHPHGGFFSKADVEDLVAYAKARYIEIIPEIEMPGHSVAAIAAYPALSCFDRDLNVATHFGVYHDTLCAGKESTYALLFDILDEVCEMFPSGMIHIGGDDVPLHRWQHCPHCQAYMKAHGLRDEAALYAAFMQRIAAHLEEKGVRVLARKNAELDAALPSSVVFQTHDGEPPAGNPCIDSSRAFDLSRPYAEVSLKDCYTYAPKEGTDAPFGVEACLWTAYTPTLKTAGAAAFPRLGAFCESAWSDPKERDFNRFLEKLPSYHRLLETLPVPYALRRRALPGPLQKFKERLSVSRRALHNQTAKRQREDRKIEKL